MYLPIKQIYFDQIVSGKKKEEYREIKDTTAKRYLLTQNGKFVRDPQHTEDKEYFIDDYNGGHFPFLPAPIDKLELAVGYNTNRDTAVVAVKYISFEPARVFNNKIAFWVCVFHLGEVLEVKRKK